MNTFIDIPEDKTINLQVNIYNSYITHIANNTDLFFSSFASNCRLTLSGGKKGKYFFYSSSQLTFISGGNKRN
ncbi:unnamed protein product [Rotaria socialis]